MRYWNLKESLGFDPRNVGELCAIGACSKFVDETLPDVDMSGRKRVTRQEISAIMTMWKLAVVAVLAFVGLNLWGKYQVTQVQQQLRKEKTSAVRIADFAGLSADRILSMSGNMENKKSNYDKLLNSYTLTPTLLALGKIMPEGMWLTKFTYNEGYSVAAGFSVPTIEMEGYVNSPKGEWKADIDMGNKFREALSDDPMFAPFCKPNAASKGAEITFPVETTSTSAKAKKGTRFILRCREGGKK
ncbi:hypothetical protein AAIR98_000991 [Elusimicrobium simillimum]|uniref:hypothetical protein n=1 Tax=Elusimicrobium simillimum TaxID=3143438 RepID=UPI003C702B40